MHSIHSFINIASNLHYNVLLLKLIFNLKQRTTINPFTLVHAIKVQNFVELEVPQWNFNSKYVKIFSTFTGDLVKTKNKQPKFILYYT